MQQSNVGVLASVAAGCGWRARCTNSAVALCSDKVKMSDENMKPRLRSIAASLFLAIALLAGAEAEVAVVFSVARHGARNVLVKTPFLREADAFGGPSLLPIGQRMCYQAGRDYSARYLDPQTCSTSPTSTCMLRWEATGSNQGNQYGVVNSTNVGFNNYNTLITSSSLDRALQSAQSFMAGVFPAIANNSTSLYLPSGHQVVPVYTTREQNDYLIRAYSKCPAYDAMLESWYGSAEFKAKADETAELRNEVKRLYPSFDTSLENWWNVYDPFNAWFRYKLGEDLTVPRTLMDRMNTLAAWLEVSKMRSTLTGPMLGGALLAELYNRFDAAGKVLTARSGSGIDLSMYQILGFSAHYNTQLGVLAALKLDTYWPALLATTRNGTSWLATGVLQATDIAPKLPALASIVAFELHAPSTASTQGAVASTSDLAVRLVLQDGPGQAYIVVPMPCQTNESDALGGPDACPLPMFLSYINGLALSNDVAWCTVCRNTNMTACQLASLQSKPGCSKGHADWEIALAVVASVVGTAALVVGLVAWWMYRKQRATRLDQTVALTVGTVSSDVKPAQV